MKNGIAMRALVVAAVVVGVALPAAAGPPGNPRPEYSTTPVIECTEHFCLHYVTTGPDAIDPTDDDSNGVPDLAELMIAELESSWSAEVGRDGFQAPLADDPGAGQGPNELADMYVQDGGSFVVADGPEELEAQSSWMGLERNFSNQIPGVPAEVMLRDTIPHEFFHMIQCGYDCGEPDAMIREGTAVWMADRVYEGTGKDVGVTLEWTSLVHPELPIDGSGGGFGPEATTGNGSGSWLFFRFLSERLGPSGSDPSIVRAIWETTAEPDTFSLEAINTVAAAHNSSFIEIFTDYAVANYLVEDSYEEGGSYVDDAAHSGFQLHPHAKTHRFGKVRRVSKTIEVDHLALAYVSFVPAPKGKPKDLLVSVAAPAETDPSITALITKRSGDIRTKTLSPTGDEKRLLFDRRKVKRVTLVLVNASTAFECGASQEPTPCFGIPVYDDVAFDYTSRLIARTDT